MNARIGLRIMGSLVMGSLIAALVPVASGFVIQGPPIASAPPPKREGTHEYSWHRNDARLSLMMGDEVVWRFNFGADQAKPFFDPVSLPGMGNLTWNAPPDHPWHHGIWFSWKLINGVNYWEEDRQTGLSDGRLDWKVVAIDQHKDFSAQIELDLKYHLPAQAPVLIERRIVKVSAPDAEGGYRIDWIATFTATDNAVVLDRTPLPNEPNGKIYGGYAGLSVRMSENAARFEIVNSRPPKGQELEKQPTRMRFKAPAVDNSGTSEGVTGGIAILDHPENLNAPSPWYIIRDTQSPMTYFSPAVIQKSPHELAAGDSFTLRYRILVHPGRYDSATLLKLYGQFGGDAR